MGAKSGASISGSSAAVAGAGAMHSQPSGTLSRRVSQAQGLGGPSFSSAPSVSEPSGLMLATSQSFQQPSGVGAGSGVMARRASEAVGSVAGLPSAASVTLPPRASSMSGAIGAAGGQAGGLQRPSEVTHAAQPVAAQGPYPALSPAGVPQSPRASLQLPLEEVAPSSNARAQSVTGAASIVLQPPDTHNQRSTASSAAAGYEHARQHELTVQQDTGPLPTAFAAPAQQSPRSTWPPQQHQAVGSTQRPASASVYSHQSSYRPAPGSTVRPVSASLSQPIQTWLYDSEAGSGGHQGGPNYSRPFSGDSSSSNRLQPKIQYPWQLEGGPRHRSQRRPVSASPVMQQQYAGGGAASASSTGQGGIGVYLYATSGGGFQK